MKLDIDVRGLRQALATLQGFSDRRINAVIATALTRTAVEAKAAVTTAIPRVIDRPTPYTLRSVFARGARADKLSAEVFLKDDLAGSGTPATKYLLPQVEGGARRIKRFEQALQAKGSMPVGWQAVPAAGARLDAYGNVSRGQIIQILSQVGAELTAGFNRAIVGPKDGRKGALARRRRALGRAGGQYVAFPKPQGKLKPGVYLAEGRDFGAGLGYGRSGKLKPVFIFVKATTYKRRLDFYGIVNRVATTRLQPNVEQAVREHIARLAAAQKGA